MQATVDIITTVVRVAVPRAQQKPTFAYYAHTPNTSYTQCLATSKRETNGARY
jgi:hypothetical protein